MALASTDIDAQLEQMAVSLRSLRSAAQEVKRSTNRAVSELSQFSTTHAEVITAVADLDGANSPVAQVQSDRLAIILAEAAELYAAVSAVKAGIDQLGL